MGYIVIGRPKDRGIETFINMGPYEYEKKTGFGSLRAIKKQNPDWDISIVKVTDKRIK